MPRRKTPPPALHELETLVMEQIWGLGRATTVREVLELLKQAGSPRAYTTIMTTMTRLDRKALLCRERQGKTDVYRATLSRSEYLEARAASEVGALVAEFGDLALAQFAKQVGRLDPERRRQLERLAGDG